MSPAAPSSAFTVRYDSATSRPPFRPSQNWTTLRQSLPEGPSKKRKRGSQAPTASKPKKEKKTLTAYNPWRPNESPIKKRGNTALVLQTSQVLDKAVRVGRYVAIDCEMVGTGPDGTEEALARVSIVNYYGHVLLDTHVIQTERVMDWRTKYSGIRPADVRGPEAQPFDKVQARVGELIKNRILIGHALKGDLAVLNLSHPRQAQRDTSLYEPFRIQYGSRRTPSLQKVVKGELEVNIQVSEHDSIEDAQAAMALYRKVQEDFEMSIRISREKSRISHPPVDF